jgi:hypothetical protein
MEVARGVNTRWCQWSDRDTANHRDLPVPLQRRQQTQTANSVIGTYRNIKASHKQIVTYRYSADRAEQTRDESRTEIRFSKPAT